MAKGRKTGGRDIKPGTVLNPNGRPKLPEELKEARKARRTDVEIALEKFMGMNMAEVKAYQKNPDATAFERILVSIIINAVNKGDHSRLSFLLDSWVGPIVKKIEGEFAFGHKSIIEQLEEDD